MPENAGRPSESKPHSTVDTWAGLIRPHRVSCPIWMLTSSSCRTTPGKSRNMNALRKLKAAVFTLMPMPRQRMATRAKPGVRRSARRA